MIRVFTLASILSAQLDTGKKKYANIKFVISASI